jgi:outer membrane protein TolC
MYKRNLNQTILTKVWLFVLISLAAKVGFAQATSYSFTLEEAQKYAVEHSYMSQSSQKEVLKSQKKVNETIGTGLPQVSATGNYQRYIQTPVQLIPGAAIGQPEREFVEVFFGTKQQMSMGVRADQLIFDGSYFVGLQAARVYLELSKNELEKTEIDVKSMITEAYGNVLVAERNVEILKGNVDNLEKSAFETEEMYKNGFVEEQDWDQIKLTLANVRNAYEQAVRLVDISRNQLKFSMGIDVNSTLELKDNLESISVASSSVDYLSNEFDVSSHIDFRSVSTQEHATKLLWKQQKSTALPKLSAFYNFQTSAYSNEFDFFDTRYFPNQLVGLNLNVPIFSGLSRSNRIQQARIDHEKTEIAKKQVEQQLTINAQNARSQYTFALSQYNTTESNMELAESIYQKTKIKYDEGISTSLELTQANNQLLESQGNYINAAFQLINAKSNLDKALNQN